MSIDRPLVISLFRRSGTFLVCALLQSAEKFTRAGAISIWLLPSLGFHYGFSRSYLHGQQVSERDGSRDFFGRGQETIAGS